jgi:hypothetical protein
MLHHRLKLRCSLLFRELRSIIKVTASILSQFPPFVGEIVCFLQAWAANGLSLVAVSRGKTPPTFSDKTIVGWVGAGGCTVYRLILN